MPFFPKLGYKKFFSTTKTPFINTTSSYFPKKKNPKKQEYKINYIFQRTDHVELPKNRLGGKAQLEAFPKNGIFNADTPKAEHCSPQTPAGTELALDFPLEQQSSQEKEDF